METAKFEILIEKIKKCSICTDLPLGANPVVQLSQTSKIMVIGQAPGRKVHDTGIPWNDKSGENLRQWLNVTKEEFYNPALFGIMPMGFCYPGKGKSGDLPPKKECARLWHPQIMEQFITTPPLTLLIGQYAQQYYLKQKGPLTKNIRDFNDFLPQYFVLPHPSPRNQYWVQKNTWFTQEVIPALQQTIRNIINKQ